ncbi:MAG: hypothetical protein DHS20C18_33860 [Saprospiraceae bacterium]|nr:MAG: hypothetical protein DHS20C18_33860 [Saprospiraceae bacterium]
MKIRVNKSENDSNDPANKMLDWTGQNYRSFKSFVAIQDGDSLGVVFMKAGLHVLGLLLMVLLSPFLVIGLTIAFLAVM